MMCELMLELKKERGKIERERGKVKKRGGERGEKLKKGKEIEKM